MNGKLIEIYHLIITVEFWENCLNSFKILGPLAPIILAALESLIPALPLIAIVTLNVTAHGAVLGFLYSWIGAAAGSTIVFLFFRKIVKRLFLKLVERHPKVKKARDWVNRVNPKALFFIAILPFTPSSFLNFAFGISDFDEKKYLIIMICAKAIMIALLALFGQSFVQAFENPVFIVVAVVLVAALYIISKKVCKAHHLS